MSAPGSVSVVDEFGQLASWLRGPVRSAAEFADVAWIVAQALGPGVLVERLEVRTHKGSTLVDVSLRSAGAVRAAASRLGFMGTLGHRDGYSSAWGRVGSITVYLEWSAPIDDAAGDW